MIKDLVLNSPSTLQASIRQLKMGTLANLTSKAWLQSCEQAAKINKTQINESINSALLTILSYFHTTEHRGSDKTVNNKKYPTNLCQEWNSECDWKSFNCIFHNGFLFSPLP